MESREALPNVTCSEVEVLAARASHRVASAKCSATRWCLSWCPASVANQFQSTLINYSSNVRLSHAAPSLPETSPTFRRLPFCSAAYHSERHRHRRPLRDARHRPTWRNASSVVRVSKLPAEKSSNASRASTPLCQLATKRHQISSRRTAQTKDIHRPQ